MSNKSLTSVKCFIVTKTTNKTNITFNCRCCLNYHHKLLPTTWTWLNETSFQRTTFIFNLFYVIDSGSNSLRPAVSHVFPLYRTCLWLFRVLSHTSEPQNHTCEMICWKKVEIHNNHVIKWFPLHESAARPDSPGVERSVCTLWTQNGSSSQLNGAVCRL